MSNEEQQPSVEVVWNAFSRGFEAEYGRKALLKVDVTPDIIDKLMELVEHGAQPSDIIKVGRFNGKLLRDILTAEPFPEMVFAKKRA